MKKRLTPPPLRKTLTLAVVLLVTVLMLLNLGVELAWREPQRVEAHQFEAVHQLLDNVQQNISTDIVQGNMHSAEQALALHATHPDVEFLAATDQDGKILFSTRFAFKSRLARDVIAGFDPVSLAQVREGRKLIIRKSPSGDTYVGYAPLVLAAPPGQLRPSQVGALILEYDIVRAKRNAWRETLAPGNWWSLLSAVLISAGLLTFLLNRWVSRPVRHLSRCVKRLAAGGTGVRVDVQGSSELASLGRGIDHLSQQIAASESALQTANRELERQVEERTAHLEQEIRVRVDVEKALSASETQLHSVLTTATEGVALWDTEGVLRYANPTMKTIFGSELLQQGTAKLSDFIAKIADSEGEPLRLEESPVAAAMQGKRPPEGVVVQIDRPDTGKRWLSFNAAPVIERGHQGFTGIVASVTDITDLKTHAELLANLANFDTLTGLPNRRLLQDRMQQAIAQHRRLGMQLAVCYLDLDGFKAVNDRYGHDVGDELLKQAAKRVGEEIRTNDTLARLAGDEFVILLGDLHEPSDCEPVLARILHSLAEPYWIAGNNITATSASIGITPFPADDSDPDTLLRHADHAMYVAKHAGKNTFKWFNPGQQERLNARRQTRQELRQALEHGDLVLHYQPNVNCRDGTVVGAEALIRWQHPVLGMLRPVQFLPLVEDNDLAVEIGDFVIAEALRQRNAWQRQGQSLAVSANVFKRQLQRPDFVSKLVAQVDRFGAQGSSGLVVEIIEHAALEGIADISKLVHSCRESGVNFALDDFGTGYSALDHLRRIPAKWLKIDSSFIGGMLTNPEDRSLVSAIIGLGRAFDREIIAEGVENLDQVRWLLNSGCEVMQGYYFAQPMPPEAFLAWLQNFRPDPAWTSPRKAGSDRVNAKISRV